MGLKQARVILTPEPGAIRVRVVVGNATGKEWGELLITTKDCESSEEVRARVLEGLRALGAPEGAKVVGAPPLPAPKNPKDVFVRGSWQVPLPSAGA